MGSVGGATMRLGSSKVVCLEIAEEVKDGLRIEATARQDGDEQQAHLGQG